MRRVAAVRRIADAIDPGSAAGTLRATLAAALGDQSLRVVYPLAGGAGFVDEQGGATLAPERSPGRAITSIERDGELVAVIDNDASIGPEVLSREMGAAARLAIDNERLEAAIRARLAELRASRSRIVEEGDTARGRLERDLHDGAQQRLLALSYELRLASGTAESAPDEAIATLHAAIAEVDQALVELRELAHGIYPAILAEAGLDVALMGIAELARVPVTVEAAEEGRCSATSEAAAYLVAVEAIRRAEAAAAPSVRVDLSRPTGRLRLDIRVECIGEARASHVDSWLRLEDRVGAAGGTLTFATGDEGHTLICVDLPCA